MRRIAIIYDTTWEECDKAWLYKEIDKQYEDGKTIRVDAKFVQSRMGRKGKGGMVRVLLDQLRQCFKAWTKTSKGDTIVCWASLNGMLMNIVSCLLGNRRHIVAMNWLTPGKERASLFHEITAKNHMVSIIVNSKASVRQWADKTGVEENRFHFVPDTYNDRLPFLAPSIKKEKYFFTGGMNNRDWNMLMKIAKVMPNEKFVGIALKETFDKVVSENIPSNVKMLFDTPSDLYYDLMKNSYAVLLPLMSDSVAGLINITMSAQYGVPCLSTRTPATEMYYPNECHLWLVESKGIEAWKESIESITPEIYLQSVSMFQCHIRETFSPATIARQILRVAVEGNR